MADGERTGEIIPERRREPRVMTRLKARLSCAGMVLFAPASGLSTRGVFLATNHGFPDDSRVELSIDLDDGHDPLEVVGRVARSDDNPGTGGLPITFDEIEAEDVQRIEALRSKPR